MKTVRVKIDPLNPAALPVGRVDYQILDSTTESQLADQQKIDDAEEKRKFETGYRNLPEGRELQNYSLLALPLMVRNNLNQLQHFCFLGIVEQSG